MNAAEEPSIARRKAQAVQCAKMLRDLGERIEKIVGDAREVASDLVSQSPEASLSVLYVVFLLETSRQVVDREAESLEGWVKMRTKFDSRNAPVVETGPITFID